MNAPDRAAWLAARRLGIGGSDIAALLGLSPYRTQVDLWMDKTGRLPDIEPDADAAERMHWGTVLEDVVARHYADRRSVRIQRINTQLQHPRYPAALANIDRAVVTEGSRARWDEGSGRVLGADRILEVKTAHALAANSSDWGDPGSDEVPQHYWLQVQWYLAITGLPCGDLAVLFGGQKFAEYTIHADTALQGDLLAQAQGWWERHVVGDMPPDPRTEDDARALWRSHRPGVEKIVDADVAQAVAELQAIKAQIGNEKTEGTLEHRMRQLRDAICCAFGEAEAISYMGRKLATWKANKPSEKTDWRALTEFMNPQPDTVAQFTTTTEGARVLRLSTPKESS
jgi:putative phage-type endonuclease